MWWIWAVETDLPWPDISTDVAYDGRVFNLAPASTTDSASIAVNGSHLEGDETSRAVYSFMSVLSWIDRKRAILTWSVGNPGFRQPMRRMISQERGFHQSRSNFDFLPVPPSPTAKLALAFHREAVSTNSDGNRFLQYFRILELVHGESVHSPKQFNELVSNTPLTPEATQACERIRNDRRSVGKTVSALARNAVAHGYEKNVITPDDRAQTVRRLGEVLPIVECLALHAIEHDLQVPTRAQYYREHAYEVEGIQSALSPETLQVVRDSSDPPITLSLPFDLVSIATRHKRYAALESLRIVESFALIGTITIVVNSDDGLVNAVLNFDLRTRRLNFDLERQVVVYDNGSADAVLHQRDIFELLRDLIGNAEIHVWFGDLLLGRKDPNIPVNIDARRTFENLERLMSELSEEAERRRSALSRESDKSDASGEAVPSATISAVWT
jgi:hypothetical protein